MKFFGSVAAVVDAVLLTGAQTVAGIKTFTSAIVASAGIQLASLWNTNGTGASDVAVKVGTSTADGSVNAGAKLLSVRTGVGATEVEKAYTLKDGTLVVNADVAGLAGFGVFAAGRPAGFYYEPGAAFLGMRNAGGAGFLGFNIGNGLASCSASFQCGTGNFYAGGGSFFSSTSGGSAQTGSLVSGKATGATDVAWKLGASTADASVNAAAKLLSLRTGIGATEVEKAHVVKDGTLEITTAGAGIVLASPDGTRYRLTIANGGAVNIAAA